jgi:hypothetical protein
MVYRKPLAAPDGKVADRAPPALRLVNRLVLLAGDAVLREDHAVVLALAGLALFAAVV